MVVPISPGKSLDTASIENSWFSNTIFVLQMDGQGLPSPNIYECVDLLRISGFPPSLTNAFLPIQDLCAPVSTMHFKTLGLLVWKLIEVEPNLFAPLSLQPRREQDLDLGSLDLDPRQFMLKLTLGDLFLLESLLRCLFHRFLFWESLGLLL